ncbi:MAG: hypothetical protein IJ302_00395 [Clostridia bacterium]|nr:hypothetical protein [Clostridia bacterium]
MNRADFSTLLDEIMHEITEKNGTFSDTFGEMGENELARLRTVAAVALMAADRYYARQTKLEYGIRYENEIHCAKES